MFTSDNAIADVCLHFKGIFMLNMGDRLREERERLGLSQTDFGAIGGVKRHAQAKYEANERSPDANYLARISNQGADVAYILTGQRYSDESTDKAARKSIKLKNFGALIALGFGRKGTASVLMGWPEVRRILVAIADFAQKSSNPDEKATECVKYLTEYFGELRALKDGQDISLLAEVVIAQHGVTLNPIIPTIPADSELQTDKQDEIDRTLRLYLNEEPNGPRTTEERKPKEE